VGAGAHSAAGSGPGGDSPYKPPKPFDPDDIFGDDGSKGSVSADPRGKKSDMASGPTLVRRWFEVGPNQKWKTRGFVLRLVMDEREIPTLLTSLTQSAFPVEILHIEHAVHLGGAGTDATRATQPPPVLQNGEVAEPQSREQQELQRKIQEGLNMAFKMHYLADVIVAGKFTVYFEPAAARSRSAVAAASTTSSRPASASPASGTAIGKAAGSSAKSAVGVPAKSVAGQARPAAKSAPSSPAKAPPGATAQPVKTAPSAAIPASGKKTNPVPTPSGPSGK
jgi:hypothetical protein